MPRTPAITMPTRVRFPCETLKPANSMIASLGIGMHALSSTIRMKTPHRPVELIRSVAALTIGWRTSAGMSSRIAGLAAARRAQAY